MVYIEVQQCDRAFRPLAVKATCQNTSEEETRLVNAQINLRLRCATMRILLCRCGYLRSYSGLHSRALEAVRNHRVSVGTSRPRHADRGNRDQGHEVGPWLVCGIRRLHPALIEVERQQSSQFDNIKLKSTPPSSTGRGSLEPPHPRCTLPRA